MTKQTASNDNAAYQVEDARTGKVVASYDDRTSADNDADQRDAAYGAVRYRVVRDYDVMSADEYAAMMVRVRAERVAA